MMVTVPMKVSVEPMAPKIPSRLFQNPKNSKAKRPFGNAEKPTGAAEAEDGIEPENQRAIADVRDQDLRLISEPFLVAKARKMSTIDARMRW
jgi:hypothetical protein